MRLDWSSGVAHNTVLPRFASLVAASLLLVATTACRDTRRDELVAVPPPKPEVAAAPAQLPLAPPVPVAPPVEELTIHNAPSSVIAVGDVHGDVDALRRTLAGAGVINAADEWIAADTVLVFTGDLLDRGTSEPQVMALVRALQASAPQANGMVLVALGNHEIMNVAGDYRYVAEAGWAGWDAGPIAEGDPRLTNVPDFARQRVAAFQPGGTEARWLATLPVFLRVDDSLFVHGGAHDEHVEYGLQRLNREVSQWMLGQAPMPAFIEGDTSPVWTRYWSQPDIEPLCPALGTLLDRIGVRRLVVGHTVQANGINSACDGRVWRIDAGMSAHYGGPGGALRIVGDVVDVIATQ